MRDRRRQGNALPSPYSNDEEPSAELRNAIVRRVHHRAGYRVIEGSKLFAQAGDDGPIVNLFEVRDILEQHRLGAQFANEAKEIKDKIAPMIVEPFLLSEDAEWLTGRPAYKQIDPLLSGKIRNLLARCLAKISHMASRTPIAVIVIEGFDRAAVVIQPRDDTNARVQQPGGNASTTGKEFNGDRWRFHSLSF